MNINLDDLTIGQVKKIQELNNKQNSVLGLNSMIGKKVIIRTYSAGVWFGFLSEKSGNEVILKDARRMWRWWASESISLSAVSRWGINQDKSKIISPVESVWLEAIEIIPCTDDSIASIEGAPYVNAQ